MTREPKGRTPLFNVRMEDELLDAIDDAAEREGLRKSVWAREVLGAVAFGRITLERLGELIDQKDVAGVDPHPPRYLSIQAAPGRTQKLKAECLHPLTAIRRLPFTDVCSMCGITIRRR